MQQGVLGKWAFPILTIKLYDLDIPWGLLVEFFTTQMFKYLSHCRLKVQFKIDR